MHEIEIEWYEEKSICIVLSSKGYPDDFEKGIEIKNLDKLFLMENEFIFHAGTKKIGDRIFSNGGRVLNFTSLGNNFKTIRKKIMKLIKKLNWKNGFFREDIGWKVINKNANYKR